MLMTRELTDFYLKRLTLFMRVADIARALDASWPSVDRWVKGLGEPRLEMKERLEDLLCDVCDMLTEKGFDEVADLIHADGIRPKGSAKEKYSPQACKGFLISRLTDGPKRYDWIMAEAAKRHFSRSQISHAARQLGVKREVTTGRKEHVKPYHDSEGKVREKVIPATKTTSVWSLDNED